MSKPAPKLIPSQIVGDSVTRHNFDVLEKKIRGVLTDLQNPSFFLGTSASTKIWQSAAGDQFIPELTGTLKTRGRPVVVSLVPFLPKAGVANQGVYLKMSGPAGTGFSGFIRLFRNGVKIVDYNPVIAIVGATNLLQLPGCIDLVYDDVAAGQYRYEVAVNLPNATTTMEFRNLTILVREL